MRPGWVCWLSACALVACATGEEISDEGYLPGEGGSGADAGAGGLSGGTGGGGGFPSGGSGGTTGGTGGVAGSGTGGVGTGGIGGTGASGGTGATGGGGACNPANTCPQATNVGTVSGDTGSASVSHSAYTSEWVKVRVTEDDSSVFGTSLRVTATLTPASSTDYDIYGYVNTGSDVLACGTSPFKKSENGGVGAKESMTLEWGEGTIANGGDDSRWVVVEVRYKSGPCDSTSKWQLTLKGN